MSGKGIYDIHCHIVPGVDDGATDIEETGKLLRMEYEQGVRTIIATPHFRFRMFETSAEKVKEQFKLVEKAAAEVASDLHVYLGCEFHTNMEMISMLRENMVLTFSILITKRFGITSHSLQSLIVSPTHRWLIIKENCSLFRSTCTPLTRCGEL